jgi:apolipoprotein N-acyltransferase
LDSIVLQQNAYLRTFAAAMISMACLWLAFPPVGWWWLGWIALVPLVWLIAIPHFPVVRVGQGELLSLRTSSDEESISSARSHYWMLYFAGAAYWLATFYFITFPHPALWLGWLAVSLYMAIYTPMLVGVSRILVHRYRLPIVLVFPIVGTGLEWFRSVFLSGMPMVCLSHSQFRQPALIQVADLSGAYTLTFAMLAVSAGLAVACFVSPIQRVLIPYWNAQSELTNRSSHRVFCLMFVVLVSSSVWGYGQFRLNVPKQTGTRSLRMALVQSSADTLFVEVSQKEQDARDAQYWDLTQQAMQAWPDLDLIIWPESSLTSRTSLFPGFDLLSDFEKAEFSYSRAQSAADLKAFWEQVTNSNKITLLVAGSSYDPSSESAYNSSILIEPPGKVVGRYFKNHLVMFGEYVPFADRVSFLQNTPLGKGLNAGTEFESFDVNGIRIAPCICFESTVPHLIRRMVRSLNEKNQSPDVLVNQTNDGWFFGTSCLDLHLACNVFRAVEMRKPMLVCANTGFSADIDPWGRLKQVGPRRKPAILQVNVQPISGLSSFYLSIGDLVPMIFGIGSLLVLLLERIRSGFRK